MKGSIRFDNEINVEVTVDPSRDEGAKLLSAVNLIDGQELSPGGGGERALNPVNITWVDLPETFNDSKQIMAYVETKTADGYEEGDFNSTQFFIIQWDDEWVYSGKIIAYSSKAEIGEYAVVMPQNYLPKYKIVVKSGDADDSNPGWVEVYGDCTLSIEAVE